jgi:hypothetical protein
MVTARKANSETLIPGNKVEKSLTLVRKLQKAPKPEKRTSRFNDEQTRRR